MYRTAPCVDRNKLYINSLIIRSYPNIPPPFCEKHTVPYSDKLGVFLGPLATALNSFGGKGEGRHSLSCAHHKCNSHGECHLYDTSKVFSNLTFFGCFFLASWGTFLFFISTLHDLWPSLRFLKRILRSNKLSLTWGGDVVLSMPHLFKYWTGRSYLCPQSLVIANECEEAFLLTNSIQPSLL